MKVRDQVMQSKPQQQEAVPLRSFVPSVLREAPSVALRQPRGTVLIVAVGVMIVLAGLVLVFARQVRVEALASGNLLASVQADAVVTGAAQYVANCLVNNTDQTTLDSEIQAEAVPLGDGLFWLIRPNPDDERQYSYGVVDEASKLNIRTATVDMLLCLPNMTPELAACIVDWQSPPNSPVTDGGGAKDEYYLQLPEPYNCKNAPFETLDELLLVKGATRELLYGVDANRNGVVDEDEATQQGPVISFNGQSQCGVCKYMTVYSVAPGQAQPGSPASPTPTKSSPTPAKSSPTPAKSTKQLAPPVVGRINVNTAPREVLLCLPGLMESDVDLIIAARTASGPDLSNPNWVAEVLPAATARMIMGLITTQSYQFSADIVAVTGDGRGFKRVKYVFDLRTTPLRILYCKDLTHLGWPLSAEIREALRAGKPVFQSSQNSFSLERR